MAISSRIASCAAYAGALLGSALALALGIDHASVGHGLWGYNSCLTAVAVATFYVPSCKGGVMGLVAIGLTVLIDAAMRTTFAPLHMPVGTLPFCAASILIMLTHGSVPGFVPVPIDAVSTAEDHLYSAHVGKTTQITNENQSEHQLTVADALAAAEDIEGDMHANEDGNAEMGVHSPLVPPRATAVIQLQQSPSKLAIDLSEMYVVPCPPQTPVAMWRAPL